MTGSHIEILRSDMGSNYLKITLFRLFLAEEILKGVAKGGTAGKLERKAGSDP